MSRTYISIDIETTGIDDRSSILQISAVADDLASPIKQLEFIDMPIKHQSIPYSEPYALGMNAELLKKMMDRKFTTFTPKDALSNLVSFMSGVQKKSAQDKYGKYPRVILAGKNVASFDIPKLRKMFMDFNPEQLGMFDELVHYKTLDVGSLYFDVFKDNVSLSEINKLTGRNQVSHNALDDAFDVVYAVRHKLGVSNE